MRLGRPFDEATKARAVAQGGHPVLQVVGVDPALLLRVEGGERVAQAAVLVLHLLAHQERELLRQPVQQCRRTATRHLQLELRVNPPHITRSCEGRTPPIQGRAAHLEVDGPAAVAVHVADHVVQLLLRGVLPQAAHHDPQLLDSRGQGPPGPGGQ